MNFEIKYKKRQRKGKAANLQAAGTITKGPPDNSNKLIGCCKVLLRTN